MKLGASGHSIVVSDPWPLKVGAFVSFTVIVWLTGPETLPAQSTAVQVRVML